MPKSMEGIKKKFGWKVCMLCAMWQHGQTAVWLGSWKRLITYVHMILMWIKNDHNQDISHVRRKSRGLCSLGMRSDSAGNRKIGGGKRKGLTDADPLTVESSQATARNICQASPGRKLSHRHHYLSTDMLNITVYDSQDNEHPGYTQLTT